MPSPLQKKNLDATSVIIAPRITEKASVLSERGVYTFDVTPFADKYSVTKAMKELYKVNAVDVRFNTTPGKPVFSRGKAGFKKGGKKAYVTLKKGETIQFV